jgi:hypothetical protein
VLKFGPIYNRNLGCRRPRPTAQWLDQDVESGQSVDIERIPLGRRAGPAEVAWPIAFLCSPAGKLRLRRRALRKWRGNW